MTMDITPPGRTYVEVLSSQTNPPSAARYNTDGWRSLSAHHMVRAYLCTTVLNAGCARFAIMVHNSIATRTPTMYRGLHHVRKHPLVMTCGFD